MLITRASEYAILSLLLLAKSDTPTDSETLSRELFISKSFLAKILQSLAKDKILHSYKGVKGGFKLAVSPKNLDLLTIISSVEGKNPSVFECSSSIESCTSENKSQTCTVWPFLSKLQGKIDLFLSDLKLSDLIEQ